MPIPKRDDLRIKIRARAEELALLRSEIDPPLVKMLALEFVDEMHSKSVGAAIQMVGYYIHGRKKKDSPDRRIKYDTTFLRGIVLMDLEDRRELEEAQGLGRRSLNEALARYKKNLNVQGLPGRVVADRVQFNNYMDFSSTPELRAMGFSRDDVKKLAQTLKHPYGLALRAPNILYHPPSKRRYVLTLNEQKELITDPARFIKMRADHIRQNWTTLPTAPEYDPPGIGTNSDHQVDTEGTVHREDGTVAAPPPPGIKYKATGKFRQESRLITVWQIMNSKTGEVGGWIEKAENLSQHGECWVSKNACVFGGAVVKEDAQVIDRARVYGQALVSGGAVVSGSAIVRDRAFVGGHAAVKMCACVYDDAVVSERAQVSGYAAITENGAVSGKAKVFGNAKVFSQGVVTGTAKISGDMVVQYSTVVRRGKFTSIRDSR